ncbi:MAG: hypothetical protein JST54_24380 [Deltaproteobacteria bacterium]|nr:hypothetical protein [Deltaproteobacteria bacterium]
MGLPEALRWLDTVRWTADIPLRPAELQQRFTELVNPLRMSGRPEVRTSGRYIRDLRTEQDEFTLYVWDSPKGPLIVGQGRVRASAGGSRVDLEMRLRPVSRFALGALFLFAVVAAIGTARVSGDLNCLWILAAIPILATTVAISAAHGRARMLRFAKELCQVTPPG